MFRQVRYWPLQFGGWSLWVFASALFLVDDTGRARAICSYAILGVFGVTCSHALRYFLKQRGWREFNHTRLLPRIAVVISAASLLSSLLFYSINLYTFHLTTSPSSSWARSAFAVWANSLILYGVWVAIYLMFYSMRRWRDAEIERLSLMLALKEAEVRALTEQVKPHFLFNALNSIRALVNIDRDLATASITRLASLLRYVQRQACGARTDAPSSAQAFSFPAERSEGSRHQVEFAFRNRGNVCARVPAYYCLPMPGGKA